MKKFVIPSVFTAVDRLSPVVRGMGNSVSDFASRSEEAMARTNRRMRRLGDSAQNVAVKSALIGAAIVAPLGLAAKAAIDFEDKMADVAKVANVEIGSDQFKQLGDQALDLSVQLAVSNTEAAGLMANLAQGGVAIDDLQRISVIAGKVGVAFGVSADMAGESFIKTQNALGGTIESTEKLMDALNFLGNTTAASSSNLLTFMASGGSGVARAVGDSGEAVAAMGAQLISMGKSAEESATIMERFTKNTLKIDSLRAVYEGAGGGAEGMLAVIEKGSKLTGKAQDAYFQQFGEYGISLQLLGKNFDQMREKVDKATNATLIAESVNQEFANRSNTTAFRIAKMRAQFAALAVRVGEAVIPIITKLVDKLTPLISQVSDWISRNRGLVEILVKVAAVLAAVAFAISFVAGLITVYTKAVLIADGLTKAWAHAQKALNFVMSMHPMGKLIIAITVLVGWLDYLIRKTDLAAVRQKAYNDVQKSVIEKTASQRSEINKLFSALVQAEKGSAQFNSVLEKINQIQPGITEKYNLQEKSINSLRLAYNELIKSIEEKARVEAASELYTQAVQERMLLEQQAKEKAGQSVFSQFIQGFYDYDNTLDRTVQRLSEIKQREQALFEQVVANEIKPALNQPQSSADAQTEKIIRGQMNQRLDVGLAPGLVPVGVSPNVNVKTSSTNR